MLVLKGMPQAGLPIVRCCNICAAVSTSENSFLELLKPRIFNISLAPEYLVKLAGIFCPVHIWFKGFETVEKKAHSP